MKHFIILLNLSFFCLSFAEADSSSDEISLHLNKSKKAVWKIEIWNRGRDFGNVVLKFVMGLGGSNGTGFFIGPNYFVTNFHVIFSLLGSTGSSTVTLSQEGDSSSLTIKRVLAVSALYDLVLLETEESITDYLSLREKLPNPNEPLFLLAYPDGIFKKIEKTGGIIYENDREFAFITNNSNLNGASGSPVLDDKGQVVGVASGGSNNKLNAIKINHLKELVMGSIGTDCAETEIFKAQKCIKEGIEHLKRLAEEGSIYAQKQLAFMYLKGDVDVAYRNFEGAFGRDRFEKAFRWYKMAAEQGYTEAQYQLAHMYYRGEGVDRDISQALHWFERAAFLGHTEAQHKLARIYFKSGFLRDLNQALYWCQKAAEQGYPPARTLLYLIERDLKFQRGKGIRNRLLWPQNR